VLAIAGSAVFGGAGVLVGLAVGVRSVTRDEGRYAAVGEAVESLDRALAKLRLDWGTTLESLEQLAAQIEKGRRRIAASDSAQRRKLDQDPGEPPALTPSQQRDEIRRRIRRVV